MLSSEEVVKMIYSKSILNEWTGCLVWQGLLTKKGYGTIKWKGKNRTVHRIVYGELVGDSSEFHVLHRCDNRRCINIEHLFLGTNKDNIDDKCKKDRSGKKLNKAKVLEIKQMLAAGVLQYEIARRFGVHQAQISKINSGKRWSHIASVGG